MTISSTNRTAGPFLGNATTTVFPFTFKVFSASEIFVSKTVIATGVSSTLTNGSDYTVTLNPNQNSAPGGTITFAVAPIAGVSLAVTSQVAALQPEDLTNQGGFYPAVINNALDRLTILIQQAGSSVLRGIGFPLGDSANAQLPAASQRANKYLGFDSNGGVIAVEGAGNATPISPYMTPVVQAPDSATARSLLEIVDSVPQTANKPLALQSFFGGW